MNSSLQLYDAQKRFGQMEVLSRVSFELAQGEILGLFGRNGSGKSTLLKILFGTLKADTLDLRLNGLPIEPMKNMSSQHIGYLPQDNFLPKHLKVRDVIPLFYADGEEQDTIFRANFIEKIAALKIGTLSMGQKRYLELLLIAHLPHPFLMLDEPFSMIEPLYKEVIQEFLLSLKAKKGILLTDHYYNDVLKISDRNLVLVNGTSQVVNQEEDLRTLGYLQS